MFLITGSSGFVGQALTSVLKQQGMDFLPFNRRDNANIFNDNAISAVVHLAARVHVMNESTVDPLTEFRQSNVAETLSLARRAALAGVKRFVYVSSIGVNGDSTTKAFTEVDEPHPHNAYSVSKYEAELALKRLALETGLEVVIVRAPLVYGANAPGNFGSLLKWISKGIPLPFGAIHNQRSLLYIGNLVNFLILCAQPHLSNRAANETFLISDGQDVSTTYLLKSLAQILGKPARLVPVPAGLLGLALSSLGKRKMAISLLSDLQIDSSKARTLLAWQPPYTVAQGLKACVK